MTLLLTGLLCLLLSRACFLAISALPLPLAALAWSAMAGFGAWGAFLVVAWALSKAGIGK